MTPKQVELLRQAAIKKLARTQHRIASTATTDAVTAPINPTYKRTFTRMRTPHKDMAGSKYSRVADINRAQPPMITPDGAGNGRDSGQGRRRFSA